MSDSIEYLINSTKLIKIYCSYCSIDITLYLRIKCYECLNFNLCCDCFNSCVELLPHLNTHKYRIVDCLNNSIFNKDWSTLDELLLLEGIEKYGLGNWKNISEYIGTKTSKNCENHYWNDYLGRFGYCLPVNTILPHQQTQVFI